MGSEFFCAPGSSKEPAFVFLALRLDHECSFKRRFTKDHGQTFTSGIGTTNRPPQSRTNAICSMTSVRMFHGRIRT